MDELEAMDQELEALAKAQRDGTRGHAPLPAEFVVEAVYDDEASKKEGRPIYRDREKIIIRVGSRDTVEHEVTAEDKRMYASQYLAWKKGEDLASAEGFPIAQWGMCPGKAVAKQFAIAGIRTVEQLAAATDATLQAVGPYTSLRQLARDWMADAQKQAPIAKLRQENETLAQRVKTLEEMLGTAQKDIAAARAAGGVLTPAPAGPDPRVAALEAQMAALVAAVQAKGETPANGTPKRRGRPPKVKPPPEPGGEA